MDTRVVLSKAVALIYRSRLVNNTENDDVIRTTLSIIKTDSAEFNFGTTNVVKKLKDFCLELLEDKEPISKEVILPRLALMLEKDVKLSETIRDSISPDYDESSNKRIVTSLIKNLHNFYRETQAVDIINGISYDLKFNRSKIANFSDYLKDTLAKLEPYANGVTSLKDPAMVNELDFDAPESVTAIFEEVRNSNVEGGVYRFGLQGINRALSRGGIMRGETMGVEALQHKYKTGSTLSMFMHIPMHNKPIATPKEIEEGKKPLMLRISFEDSLNDNLQFMYQYLKAVDGTPVKAEDFKKTSPKEMTDYIMPKLTVNGFHIKMMRIDPNQWTYSSIMNKVIELEAEGYAIHVLMLDYLLKVPTTGCLMGALGMDKRDMLRRMRNFCSARHIALISPFQLSSEANQKLRDGVPEHDFVNEIAEKNFTDSCKTLGQELDIEVYFHVFERNGKKYLAFRRGKHRSPVIVSDRDKFCIFQFPDINIPVLEDINGDDTSFKKMPKHFDDGRGGKGSLLDEVLA